MSVTLYPGIPFSPQAFLANNIGAADTIIEVSDISAFPPAPNLATIGTDEEGETLLYAAKTDTALSGCTRGVEGTAKTWQSGSVIARNWTAKDHSDLIAALGDGQTALDLHETDVTAHQDLFARKQDNLTGQPGQAVGFGADGAAVAVPGWSSPNLLDNGYFLDPVNQRGENVYSNAGWNALYSIDRWYLSCAAWDVSAHKLTTTAAYGRIVQRLDGKALVGKTVTFSVLVSSVEGGDLQLFFGPGDIGPAVMTAGSSGLISLTITMHDPGQQTNDVFIALNTAGASAVIDAVKLELGSQQTLARQDAGGNWVLNDPPPNRALELAKCQRYFFNLFADDNTNYTALGFAVANTNTEALVQVPVPCQFRTAPVLVKAGQFMLSGLSVKNMSISSYRAGLLSVGVTVDGGLTPGAIYVLQKTDGCSFFLDANL